MVQSFLLLLLATQPDVKVGRPHPDFVLPKIDGGFGRLSDFREKKVLIFNFASW